ncbi:hypothetical protein O6H91_20G038900 [Diphasiastrum complanatum]|uniref:Uncharacterized protein n=1 Tax=Diphasiastrum complanatum TaxID=34168 RepID=A0ACC2APK3_DIPCM|nr:hypothetical protein O6H91_20G038900 [Diphasiastrum complanatum]
MNSLSHEGCTKLICGFLSYLDIQNYDKIVVSSSLSISTNFAFSQLEKARRIPFYDSFLSYDVIKFAASFQEWAHMSWVMEKIMHHCSWSDLNKHCSDFPPIP